MKAGARSRVRAAASAGAAVLALAVLAGVFTLYTEPQMMVALADMIWACFR